jgi:two-component system nitrate/nitrite sensor histidine kinase NarX
MFKYFRMSLRSSIILRTLIAFAFIIVFDLSSMLAGIYLSASIRGDAEAINKAGSLRMQSWRLALLVHTNDGLNYEIKQRIEEFNTTIGASVIVNVLTSNTELLRNYAKVTGLWHQRLMPLLSNLPYMGQVEVRRQFLTEVDAFVNALDVFVKHIENASEQKLAYIRGLQMMALVITLLMAVFIVLTTHSKVVRPLQRLISLAKNITKSDGHTERNELGMLTRTIDGLSTELTTLYSGLEKKVEAQTRELRQSNAALRLLFDTARKLYKTTDNPVPVFEELLEPTAATLGTGPVSLCLLQFPAGGRPQGCTLFGAFPEVKPGQCQQGCQQGGCANCAVFRGSGGQVVPKRLHSVPILVESTLFGYLHVETDVKIRLEDWQGLLLTALADFFAAALNLNRLGQEQARVALMEERAVIARELHDSLAQALSYQKIQVVLLKKQLDAGACTDDLIATIGQLQESISSAYRQLRELLVTFRLKLDKPGLVAGIEASIREYGRYSALQIRLDYHLKDCPLTPNEEIHCLQIVREAITNVIKHASARHCLVRLYQERDGLVSIQVDDDGIGISLRLDQDRIGHYGLAILKERTTSLAGHLEIMPLRQGTRIQVQFLPECSQGPIHIPAHKAG